jgi:hypothetical protein
MEQLILSLRITGILAILGAILYAIGDVLLLASKVNLNDYPKLKPYAKLLSDAEKMVVLPPNRMIWGALLGVFATPAVLAGIWQVCYRFRPWRICAWHILFPGRIHPGIEQSG